MKKIFLLFLFILIAKMTLFAQASEQKNEVAPPPTNVKTDSIVVNTAHAVVIDKTNGTVIKEYEVSVTKSLPQDQKPYVTNDSTLAPKKK